MAEKPLVTADIAIIGGGSAGLSAAAGCAQLGLKTVLFERDKMGGDCLNHGCVPSKALLSAARRAHAVATSEKYGIASRAPAVTWSRVQDHVRTAIETIEPNDSVERFESLGVTVVAEAGAFASPEEIVSDGVRVRARRMIVATGSKASVPPVPGLADLPFLTNETIFDIDRLPEHLIVLGGGPIGCELGQAFNRLGARVTILDRGAALCNADPDHARIVLDRCRAEGVDLRENSDILRVNDGVSNGSGRRITVAIRDASDVEHVLEGSHILVAAGRRPVLDGLNLKLAGVAYGPAGIKTTPSLRSVSNSRVWALGDAAGRGQFTHLAGWHASVFVRTALFKSRAPALHLPAVTYTEPELASIALSEEQARAAHRDVRVTGWSFSDNDRAIAENDTVGGARIWTDRKGRILGGSVVGTGAGDIVQLLSLAMSNGLGIRALTGFISPYPTRSEIIKRAAGKWYEPIVFGPAARGLVGLLKNIP